MAALNFSAASFNNQLAARATLVDAPDRRFVPLYRFERDLNAVQQKTRLGHVTGFDSLVDIAERSRDAAEGTTDAARFGQERFGELHRRRPFRSEVPRFMRLGAKTANVDPYMDF